MKATYICENYLICQEGIFHVISFEWGERACVDFEVVQYEGHKFKEIEQAPELNEDPWKNYYDNFFAMRKINLSKLIEQILHLIKAKRREKVKKKEGRGAK